MNYQARRDGYKQAYAQNVARFKEPKPKFNFGDRVRIDVKNATTQEYAIIDVHYYHSQSEYAYDVIPICDWDDYAYQDYVIRVFESQLIATPQV